MNDIEVLLAKISDFERQHSELRLKKLEIASIQIDSAIRCYFANYSLVAVSTLIFPAFQIVRDLNKDKNGSLSQAFTDVIREAGIKPGVFWKQINKGASDIKHANEGNVLVDVIDFCKDIEGAIFFSIHEYANLNGDKISSAMSVFISCFKGNDQNSPTFDISRKRKLCFRFLLSFSECAGKVRYRKSLIIAKTLAKGVQKIDGRRRKREMSSLGAVNKPMNREK